MSNQRDPLDQLLGSLPRDVPPERDLWQSIQAEIAKTPIVTDAAPVVHFASSRWFQLAAGLLLVLATSLTTFVITRQSMEQNPALQVAQQPQPVPTAAAERQAILQNCRRETSCSDDWRTGKLAFQCG